MDAQTLKIEKVVPAIRLIELTSAFLPIDD